MTRKATPRGFMLCRNRSIALARWAGASPGASRTTRVRGVSSWTALRTPGRLAYFVLYIRGFHEAQSAATTHKGTPATGKGRADPVRYTCPLGLDSWIARQDAQLSLLKPFAVFSRPRSQYRTISSRTSKGLIATALPWLLSVGQAS